MEVWQTSNLRRLRLGEEKKKEEERRRTNHSMKIYNIYRETILWSPYSIDRDGRPAEHRWRPLFETSVTETETKTRRLYVWRPSRDRDVETETTALPITPSPHSPAQFDHVF